MMASTPRQNARCRNPIVKSQAANHTPPMKLCCSILIFSMNSPMSLRTSQGVPSLWKRRMSPPQFMLEEQQAPIDSGKCIQQKKKNYLGQDEIAAHVRRDAVRIEGHFPRHRDRGNTPKAIADRAAEKKRNSDQLEVHGREAVGYEQII